MKHGDRGAFYGNLLTCGSVWWCAVCAAKITERRKVDLVGAIDVWKAQGGEVRFLTLTAPHYRGESTGTVLDRITRARRKLRDGSAYRTAMKSAGIVGSVRALEVTYGANGAHVHTHEILFCKGDSTPPDPEAVLKAWQAACERAGSKAPNGHGVSIEDGSHAGEYAAKWGMADELTKAHVKTGKDNKGRSPWDLLRAYAKDGDKAAGALFREYAHAFRGRKQLVWSKGLRDLLGLGRDKSDEEIAAAKEEEAVQVAMLDREEWRIVLANDLRCEVLEAADRGGAEAVADLLERVRC